MKLVIVDELREGEILARDVLLEDYTVLLGKGTEIKKEYIQKLRDMSIMTVYVEEPKEEIENVEQPKAQVEETEGMSVQEENSFQKEQSTEKANEAESVVEKQKEKKPQTSKIPLEELTILRDDVEQKIKSKVRDILELHVYQHTEGLEEIAETAQNIITDLLEQQEVVEKVYDVKERSADIYEHCLTTCTIATLVGLKLQLSEKDVYDISVSSLIHDLGLRYLIVRYENQDIHFLPKKQQEEYKKHAIYAYTAIKNEQWISEEAKEIILNHHEHKDSSGYPLGTDTMSRACQVMSVCDEFDEMICGIGKARVRVHEAINCIRNYSGIWYDSDIVNAFLQLIAVYPVGSKVRTNQGELAIVIKQNPHFPERPVLRVMQDKYGQPIMTEKRLDLLKDINVVIQEVLK